MRYFYSCCQSLLVLLLSIFHCFCHTVSNFTIIFIICIAMTISESFPCMVFLFHLPNTILIHPVRFLEIICKSFSQAQSHCWLFSIKKVPWVFSIHIFHAHFRFLALSWVIFDRISSNFLHLFSWTDSMRLSLPFSNYVDSLNCKYGNFTHVGKSYQSTSKVCLLALFAEINFSLKVPNWHYVQRIHFSRLFGVSINFERLVVWDCTWAIFELWSLI